MEPKIDLQVKHRMLTNILELNITTANYAFKIGGGSCYADSFVVIESTALRIKICGKMPPITNLQNAAGNTE